MQLIEEIYNESALDDILRDAAEGYGDLIAASLSHNVSLLSLQRRLAELRKGKMEFIS
jgi:hypothetical protein